MADASVTVLQTVLSRLKSVSGAVCVFDIDGTILDNKPRQARIVREFGAARGIELLQGARADHWTTWNMSEAMRRMGLDDAAIEPIYKDARAWWEARFFTSEYCVEDLPIRGAPAFVRAVAAAGAQVAYTTGRPESMRAGTLTVFAREGFPLPSDRAHLLMKQDPAQHDDAFKVENVVRLRAVGTVVAAFDNEPTHLNTYRREFPDARVVRVATEHSARPVALLPGIEEIDAF